MVDRQLARLYVDFRDGLAVDRHLVALSLWHLLIVVLTCAIEATACLPRKIVEHANVAVMSSARQIEARQKLVQFTNVRFETLGFGRALVFDDLRPFSLLRPRPVA